MLSGYFLHTCMSASVAGGAVDMLVASCVKARAGKSGELQKLRPDEATFIILLAPCGRESQGSEKR